MMTNYQRLAGLLGLCMLASAPPASAQAHTPLTYAQALELARARAPRVLAARARIDVARAAVTGASVWQPHNPDLELAAGPRRNHAGTSLDLELELGQRFELGGQRQARIQSAQAGVAQAQHQAEDATRWLLRDVAVAFHRVLHASERLHAARASQALAQELVRVAETRHKAGDAGALDIHAARVAHARAQAREREIAAEHIRALGELRLLLGLDADAPLAVQGDLAALPSYRLDTLRASAAERPDVHALAAELRQAEAELALGQASTWPELGVFVRYGREEDSHMALGGLSVSLPVFERGQGLRAASSARMRELRIAHDAAQTAVAVELRTALDSYQLLAQAAAELAAQALPSLDESLQMARKSYQAGNIAMSELLALQRELVDARMAHIDLLLEAALARIDLEATAGALR